MITKIMKNLSEKPIFNLIEFYLKEWKFILEIYDIISILEIWYKNHFFVEYIFFCQFFRTV